MISQTLTILLSLSASAIAIQFDGPSPTHAADLLSADLNGWTPRPTPNPRSLPLFRRQSDEGICGYLEGDREYPVSCTVGTCAYDASNSWFGCCTGTAISDCAVFTTCVASASISACAKDPACANDALALGCPAASAPYCVTMRSKAPKGTVAHYVCGKSKDFVVDVLPTGTGSIVGGASASVTTSATSVRVTPVSGSLSAARSSSRRSTTSASVDEPSATGLGGETVEESSTQPPVSLPRTTARVSTASTAVPAASTAGAVRTAQAVAGAVGGIAGVLAWLV